MVMVMHLYCTQQRGAERCQKGSAATLMGAEDRDAEYRLVRIYFPVAVAFERRLTDGPETTATAQLQVSRFPSPEYRDATHLAPLKA